VLSRRLLPVLLCLLALVAVPASAGVTDPRGVQQQVSAAPPVTGAPGAVACTQHLLVHDFENSYYKPGLATYVPACAGPWSKVVLSLTGTVSGTQFDRTLAVFVGGTLLLRGTTSEPCCTPGTDNSVSWTVQRDVSELSSLFTTTQPVAMELDNVNNDTYTGIYHVVVDVTFYGTTATAPALSSPSWVASVNPPTPGAMYEINKTGMQVGATIHPPRSLTRLTAQLFADGHGPCEEFWWSEPSQCGSGTPFREVAVYLDGRLAGAAPVYPVVFTGANGPGLWEPIASPRAWDLKPYVVDLTPFVGTLVDGEAHTVSVGVLDAVYADGDYWPVSLTLLGETGHGVSSGALTTYQPAGSVGTADPTATLFTQGHELTFAGWVRNAGKLVTTTVHDTVDASATIGVANARDEWTWKQSTKTDGDGHRVSVETTSTYGLANAPVAHFAFTDGRSTVTTVDGVAGPTRSYDVTMSTTAVGLAYHGSERESWTVIDGADCYRRQLTAVAGQVLGDLSGCDIPVVPDPLL
jgi:hypothetical protein